jgi:hypothetical protein
MTVISLGQAARRGQLSRIAITAAIKVGRVTSKQRRVLNWPGSVTRAFRSGQCHYPTARICRWVRRFPPGKGCPPFTAITSINARRRGSGSAQHRGNSCGLSDAAGCVPSTPHGESLRKIFEGGCWPSPAIRGRKQRLQGVSGIGYLVVSRFEREWLRGKPLHLSLMFGSAVGATIVETRPIS